ncbi:Facilitated trehalose transporter Tret1 [Gryllus bimaculatus]|nr:Facilitated trehalose transporter Tret1 [Gryllus bimaculatus]
MRRFGLTRKLVRNRQQFWKFSVILPHYENDDIGAILNNLYTAVTLFEGVGSWIAINFKARLPFFEGHDRLVRLDHGDAAFVEVVHTDAKPTVPLFGMGMVRQHGHVDYYINGGFAQPGCSVPSPFPEINSLIQFCQLQISVISQLAACAHNRATVVSVTAHYSDEYLPPAYEKCAPDSCSPLNLQNVMYPARGGFVVPSAQSQPFCIVEPEVDDIMKDMEKAVETFRNFTHDYSTKVRASIFRRVEKVGKTVGRKVGSMGRGASGREGGAGQTQDQGSARRSPAGSINLICVPVGCLASGPLTQPIGRKRSMQFINLPFIAAWLVFHFASSLAELYLALVLVGLAGGLMEAPVLTYVAEITQPHLRGMLSATSSMCVILGVFVQFLLGNFLPWRTVAAVNACFPAIAALSLFFVPESPYWLVCD